MPAAVIPITGKRQGTYVLLEAVLPERAPRTTGVLLLDSAGGRGWVRLLERLVHSADAGDAEVLEELEGNLRARLSEGSQAFLEWLEDRCSNVLRIGERRAIEVDAFPRVLDRLYDDH